MNNSGPGDKTNGTDRTDVAAVEVGLDEKDYDPEDAIHAAVLAEKEKRNLKLTLPKRTPVRAVHSPDLSEATASGSSPAQSPHDATTSTKPAQQRLSHETILLWAEMHFERTGAWPQRNSGAIANSPGEWWNLVDDALKKGGRGLPGGTSLAELLNESPRVTQRGNVTELTEEQILLWADDWYSQTGAWPDKRSSEIAAPNTDITWSTINSALLHGSHGLPGGTSLRELLRDRRKSSDVVAD